MQKIWAGRFHKTGDFFLLVSNTLYASLIYAVFTFLDILLFSKVTRYELYSVELALLFFLLLALLLSYSSCYGESGVGATCFVSGVIGGSHIGRLYDVGLTIAAIVLVFILH
jgi:hypothetical protein